jgi:hypothetical protein
MWPGRYLALQESGFRLGIETDHVSGHECIPRFTGQRRGGNERDVGQANASVVREIGALQRFPTQYYMGHFNRLSYLEGKPQGAA